MPQRSVTDTDRNQRRVTDMRINIDQGVALTPDTIEPYVYPDGSRLHRAGHGQHDRPVDPDLGWH